MAAVPTSGGVGEKGGLTMLPLILHLKLEGSQVRRLGFPLQKRTPLTGTYWGGSYKKPSEAQSERIK